ncbi:MAG: SAF domain-containing protein [Sporichthyaceae bacterium]|nr:SAF domain-containing protein [Sporichthyaceae bacterium]
MAFTTAQGIRPGAPPPGAAMPGGGPGHPLLPPRVRRRQPGLAAAGLVLTVGGAAISAALVLNAGDTVSVLTVVRDVPAGVALTRDDLAVAQVAGSGVSAVRSGEARLVIGRTTVTSIPRGTLLNAAMLTEHPVPDTGEVAVGLVLPPGNVPSIDLAGRVVGIYRVVKAPDGAEQATILVPRALVISAEFDKSGTGKVLITVVTAQSAAAAVLQASAEEEVGLAVLPVGS